MLPHNPDPETSTTGPYDRNFIQHVVEYDVFPPDYEFPDGREICQPSNLDEICQAFEQRRPSLSSDNFTRDDFKKFRRADANAMRESSVMATVWPIIQGEVGDIKCIASDVAFRNFQHLTDGSLICAKPGIYHGARPEQLHEQARRELNHYIIPSTQKDHPILPNNFVEVKGPDGSSPVAIRQVLYGAALGARSLDTLRAYTAAEPRFDNNARVLAWTYHTGTLRAYACHVLEPSTSDALPGYAMTLIDAWNLTGNVDTFCRAAGAFRNGRDWAKRQRDEVIEEANKRVKQE